MTQLQTLRSQTPLSETMQIGQIFAKSGFFEDARQEAQAIVKIMAGQELGFDPFTSMTGIHIIKGKPSVSAGLMAAAVKASPKYDYRVAQLDDSVCDLIFFENGDEVGRSKFTAQDAVKAQTQNMQKFPRNMLFARAMSNGIKFYCPDVFNTSVYTPEEMGAAVDGEGNPTSPAFHGTPLPEQAVVQSNGAPSDVIDGDVVDDAAPAPAEAAGRVDEHGYVWCNCDKQARYMRGKSASGWTCHSKPAVCDFKLKDTGQPGLVRPPAPAPQEDHGDTAPRDEDAPPETDNAPTVEETAPAKPKLSPSRQKAADALAKRQEQAKQEPTLFVDAVSFEVISSEEFSEFMDAVTDAGYALQTVQDGDKMLDAATTATSELHTAESLTPANCYEFAGLVRSGDLKW